MKPILPKDAPNPAKRQAQLERFRKLYQFDYEFLGGIPFLDKVPRREKFSLGYWIARLTHTRTMPVNAIAARIRSWFHPLRKLSDYSNLFVVEREPAVGKTWLSDESFSDQRNLGCNPQALKRIDRVPDGMPLTDAHVAEVLGEGHTLAEEIAAKRVYAIEYPELAHIKEGGTWRGRKKHVPAPRAVFVWDAKGDRLRCLGIQVRAAEGGRLFKPSDPPFEWLAAKIAIQCADATHQELGTHFAWTHTVMIPFAVCTRRQLAREHPIHIMLEPHLKYYLFDNELGRTAFINPGGPVERMMGGTLSESIGVAAAVYNEWNLSDAALPRDLARRHVDDPGNLREYPFRDDGLLVWNAVGRYVSAYLGLYYSSDKDVRNDVEVQAWAQELAAEDGGKVAGMKPRIDSFQQLVDILHVAVWTMGPLHSMLNFSQWDYIFAPNMPYALYRPIPENEPITPEALMEILPPYAQAAFQLKWNKILTAYHYDELGKYRERFEDVRARAVLDIFHHELADIEKEIEARETSRRVSFPYFKPSRIINSINT